MSPWLSTLSHGWQARRHPWARCIPAAAPALLIAIAVAVVGLSRTASAVSSSGSNYYYDGTNYYYTLFTASQEIQDGASGVGGYGVVGNGGAMVGDTIVFSDMGGPGSAIRQITRAGVLSTITGSLTKKGFENSNASQTLFSGASSGADRYNALAYGNGGYYLADTRNQAVRFTNISTGSTSNVVAPPYVRSPTALTVSTTNGVTSVYISDAGFQQVMYIASVGAPTSTFNLTSVNNLEPGALAVFASLNRVFVVDKVQQIYCWDYSQTETQSTPWNVSNPTTAVFRRILLPSSDGKKLLYVTTNGTTIASLDATTDATSAATLVPQNVINFDGSAIGGTVRLFFPRSSDSWYILSETQYMVVSTSPIDWGSSSSSGTTSTETPSSSSSEFTGRYLGIAAFPTNAFPTNDSCLMSELYYWMRVDATTVYGTNDYINEFLIAPANTTITNVRGSANVSTWCGNITTPKSNDGTITILDFWGPKAFEMWYVQSQLASAKWTSTRAFLSKLQGNGWELGPFCFINCTSACRTMTAPKCSSESESSCDGVCKGAIASSVVMGAAGVVLVVLMIVSPANLFTAIMMVPII